VKYFTGDTEAWESSEQNRDGASFPSAPVTVPG
jgi:hypothetical protein